MTPSDPSAAQVPRKASQQDASEIDPVVQREWQRLEDQRVAEERDEAHEDVLETIADPKHHAGPRFGSWQWVALAVALAAGIVFAGVVNLSLGPPLPPPQEPPPPSLHPPSQNEAGGGISGSADDPADVTEASP